MCHHTRKEFIYKAGKNVGAFLAFHLLLSLITIPLLVFYGPFDMLRTTIVGMSWHSLRHQYIARLFLPEDKIKQLLEVSYAEDPLEKGEKIQILKFGDNFSDRIDVYNIKGLDFRGKLIMVHDPTRIRVGFSKDLPVQGETVSSMARRNGAVAAMNAGGFTDEGTVGTGGKPLGFIIHEGQAVYSEIGMDVPMDTAAFTSEGMLIVGRHSIRQLMSYGVQEGVSFGPPLIVNHEPTITQGDGGWGIAPRTAIGQRADGTVLMLVVDGRRLGSLGATLKDIQDILLRYGAVNAVNLDGGSSTTMVLNSKVINEPTDALGERAIPSSFLVLPSKEDEGA